MTARFIIGDTRDVTATMADGSVDLVLTSPPFLALRSYLPADHPDKHREIGSEATPAAFLDALLELTAEWGRVLAPHGTLAVELGDTYSGSGGAGGDYGTDGLRDGQGKFDGSGRRNRAADVAAGILAPTKRPGPADRDKIAGWPLAKSKALIPELYRIALAYGINPLTGQESPAGRWRVRNVVTWCRPNPPVGALGDKFRPATSDMVIACRASDRWFDLDAVRNESPSPNTHQRVAKGAEPRYDPPSQQRDGNWNTLAANNDMRGAPPLDYWVIPPGGYPGSHYAVYPPELCRIPIESMCPRQVCTVCGQPRRRIADVSYVQGEHTGTTGTRRDLREPDGRTNGTGMTGKRVMARVSETLGWSDCGHDSWRNGIVLDPFGGSGTTGMVAVGHGRDAVLIDIDERNADLARERIGMFLEVEDARTTAGAQ